MKRTILILATALGLWLSFLATSASAQNPGPVFITFTNPNGNPCGQQVAYLYGPSGELFTCQSGTLRQVASGTSFTPGNCLTLTSSVLNVGSPCPTNAQIQAGQLLVVTTTSSSATTYTGVMAANDPLAAYANGQQFIWVNSSTACTGNTATTINIDGLGATPIYAGPTGTTNPASTQCGAGAIVPMVYDGPNTAFRIASASGGGGSAFNAITSGTNSSATMTVGTGGTLTYSGSGAVNASEVQGDTNVALTDVGTVFSSTLKVSDGTNGFFSVGPPNDGPIDYISGDGTIHMGGYNGTLFYTANLGNLALTVGTAGNTNVSAAGNLGQGTALSCSTGVVTSGAGIFTGCVASDRRLKRAIAHSQTQALPIIARLIPSEWNWRDTEARDAQRHYGFIAQDVKAVFPLAVIPAGKDTLGIDPGAMTALLAKGEQELFERESAQQKEIEQLKFLVGKLEGELESLRRK